MINPWKRPTTLRDIANPDGLRYFVTERELMRVRKERGDRQDLWTADPVLANYRFCNVRRRDDRLTRWLLQNYFPVFNSEPDMWLAATIARCINWPPTLELLRGQHLADIETIKPIDVTDVLDMLLEQKEKVYGGAYILIFGRKEPGIRKAKTLESLLYRLVEHGQDIREAAHGNSLEGLSLALQEVEGIGSFMAGQVVADLSYLGMRDAEDLYTWAPQGPGSLRGLNYLFNKQPTAGWSRDEFVETLQFLRELVLADIEFDDNIEMTLHDVQNCMCEYSKFARTVLGEGRPKTMYRPETRYGN